MKHTGALGALGQPVAGTAPMCETAQVERPIITIGLAGQAVTERRV